MTSLQWTTESTARRQHLLAIGCALPEAVATGDSHLKFTVRQKTFAYYLFDHHGDGRIALHCKVPSGEQQRLIEENPARFSMPAYLGARGWLSLWLDLPTIDWGEVEWLLRLSYTLVAPKTLRRLVETSE